jgi:hypothetical protein
MPAPRRTWNERTTGWDGAVLAFAALWETSHMAAQGGKGYE